MMSSDFYFRSKIPVAVLGALGIVGQRFVQVLSDHPWFEIIALCDSEPFVGQFYGEAVNWLVSSPLPNSLAMMQVLPFSPSLPCSLVFSALEFGNLIEMQFAEAGYQVLSLSSYPRDKHIPLIVPEVNADHLEVMDKEAFPKGGIVSVPHPGAIGLALVLKPLMDAFGIECVKVNFLKFTAQIDHQALSTNQSSKLSFEMDRIEQETLNVLGELQGNEIRKASFKIVIEDNLTDRKNGIASISIKLRERADFNQMIEAWRLFAKEPQKFQLPMAPLYSLSYHDSFFETHLENELEMKVGDLQTNSALDYTFSIDYCPLMRSVGSSLLNAELLVTRGKIYW